MSSKRTTGIQLRPEDKELLLKLRSLEALPIKSRGNTANSMIAELQNGLYAKIHKIIAYLTLEWEAQITGQFTEEVCNHHRANAVNFQAPVMPQNLTPEIVGKMTADLHRKITSAYAVLEDTEPTLKKLETCQRHYDSLIKAVVYVDKEWQATGFSAIQVSFEALEEMHNLEYVVNLYRLIIKKLEASQALLALNVRSYTGKPADARTFREESSEQVDKSSSNRETVYNGNVIDDI